MNKDESKLFCGRYGGRNPYCVICNKTKKEKETIHIVPSRIDNWKGWRKER